MHSKLPWCARCSRFLPPGPADRRHPGAAAMRRPPHRDPQCFELYVRLCICKRSVVTPMDAAEPTWPATTAAAFARRARSKSHPWRRSSLILLAILAASAVAGAQNRNQLYAVPRSLRPLGRAAVARAAPAAEVPSRTGRAGSSGQASRIKTENQYYEEAQVQDYYYQGVPAGPAAAIVDAAASYAAGYNDYAYEQQQYFDAAVYEANYFYYVDDPLGCYDYDVLYGNLGPFYDYCVSVDPVAAAVAKPLVEAGEFGTALARLYRRIQRLAARTPVLASNTLAATSANGTDTAQRRNTTTLITTTPTRTAGFFTAGSAALENDTAFADSVGSVTSVAKNVQVTKVLLYVHRMY